MYTVGSGSVPYSRELITNEYGGMIFTAYVVDQGESLLCGLVAIYGYIDLEQHWLRWWFVAWRHHAITWTNVDSSLVIFCGIHLRAISEWVPMLLFRIMSLQAILSKIILHLSMTNELRSQHFQTWHVRSLVYYASEFLCMSYIWFLGTRFDK